MPNALKCVQTEVWDGRLTGRIHLVEQLAGKVYEPTLCGYEASERTRLLQVSGPASCKSCLKILHKRETP